MARVLIVGSGAREHALAWTLARSPEVTHIYCAPGNAGSADVATLLPIAATDIPALVKAAEGLAITLVVVGPEVPLALGLVDALDEAGIAAFGPTKGAAQIESSKIFAKRLMEEAGIPTPAYRVFDNARQAATYVGTVALPVVIKADGLAAGKGVFVCATRAEALDAINTILEQRHFGDAGARVLVEQCLVGEEVSLLVLTDGHDVLPLLPARDYKRLADGDQGPNTGGMGCVAPAIDVLPIAEIEHALRTIVRPALRGLRAHGYPFRGALYVGLMRTVHGLQVLEFNARLGDPETQTLLPLLTSNLYPILLACAAGTLAHHRATHAATDLTWSTDTAVCMVLAAHGYPHTVRTGDPIASLPTAADALVFHGGTARAPDGRVVTAGGRVLSVVGRGPTRAAARAACAALARTISFEGMQYRTDIGSVPPAGDDQ